MNLTKKLVFKFNRLSETLPIQRLERVHKITEMVNQGKTDGKLVQTLEVTTNNYEDRNIVITGHRCFRDQAAAEEFRDWWLGKLTEYKIQPEILSIEDAD